MHQHEAEQHGASARHGGPVAGDVSRPSAPHGGPVPGGWPHPAPRHVHPHLEASPYGAPFPTSPQAGAPPDSRAYRFLVALWTKPAWLAPLAVLGCIGAAFTYVLANDPTDAQRDPLGPCAFKTLTGLDCPGCGGTRMVWYLLHGNVGEAARHHLVALIALPVVVYAYLVWAAKRLFNVTLPTRRIGPAVWGGYLAVWLAFSILRNLPWEPFSYFYVT